ncbi:hypothetical protein AB9P05_10480 [Roseivirga sp. BDSF3-8]|uniref:hypothetical protein n=1 Tax=Roseivirga sp. BDSF3-8 TaxID=3241598 RepID=UPI00353217E8
MSATKMRKFLFVSLIFSLIPMMVWAQEENEGYKSQFIWGVNKYTNGGLIGGLVFRYSLEEKPGVYQTYGAEIIHQKHPKELRYNSITGETFILGKSHYLYSFRLQYGREWLLFRKAPQQGVQINLGVAAGPTFGLYYPYYVEVSLDGSLNSINVPYTSNINPNAILGTGGLLQGLDEAQFKIGGNIKTYMSFEFGTFRTSVSGFELGLMLEAWPEEVILMPNVDNRQFFPSAFINLVFGTRK